MPEGVEEFGAGPPFPVRECGGVRVLQIVPSPARSDSLDCDVAGLRHQPHSQFVEQASVGVRFRIRRGQKLLAHEDRIRPGEKTQGLRFLRQRQAGPR